MGESKLLLALFCNKKLTKTVRGVVVVVFSVRFGCVTLMVTLQYYSGGECAHSLTNCGQDTLNTKNTTERVRMVMAMMGSCLGLTEAGVRPALIPLLHTAASAVMPLINNPP